VKDRWDADALGTIRQLASDTSSLLTSLEVLRRRDGGDHTIERSYALALRMQQDLEHLITLLRI
jgi:hypothetical protein